MLNRFHRSIREESWLMYLLPSHLTLVPWNALYLSWVHRSLLLEPSSLFPSNQVLQISAGKCQFHDAQKTRGGLLSYPQKSHSTIALLARALAKSTSCGVWGFHVLMVSRKFWRVHVSQSHLPVSLAARCDHMTEVLQPNGMCSASECSRQKEWSTFPILLPPA